MVLGLLFSFNVLAGEREVLKSNETEAWKVDGKFIVPECLIYEWYSGDNYEVFYETYFQKDADHGDSNFRNFIENIGLFLNKEVPLNHSIKTNEVTIRIVIIVVFRISTTVVVVAVGIIIDVIFGFFVIVIDIFVGIDESVILGVAFSCSIRLASG